MSRQSVGSRRGRCLLGGPVPPCRPAGGERHTRLQRECAWRLLRGAIDERLGLALERVGAALAPLARRPLRPPPRLPALRAAARSAARSARAAAAASAVLPTAAGCQREIETINKR